MKKRIYVKLFLALFAIFPLVAFSQDDNTGQQSGSTSSASDSRDDVKDPIKITNVKFDTVKVLKENWLRAAITFKSFENPFAEDEKSNKDWLRNVKITLQTAYQDEKMSSEDETKMVWFSANATAFALKKNSTNKFYFYIPWEAVGSSGVYRLSNIPYAYLIKVNINGREFEINKDNWKTRTNIKNGTRLKNFLTAAEANSKRNEGVMMPFHRAPIQVQIADAPKGNESMPTFILEN